MKKLLFLLLLLLTLISSAVFSDGYMFSDHSRDGSDVVAQWNGD